MKTTRVSRREFLKDSLTAAAAIAPLTIVGAGWPSFEKKAVVAIARVKNDNVGHAVEEAMDLLGGVKTLTEGKNRIVLKPNLVAESPDFTTKPVVIRTLAQLMKGAGKDVTVAEGSAAANGFNVMGSETFRTRNRDILDRMQQFVFDRLGYTELAKSMGIPLVNLHSGELVELPVPGGHAFHTITLHRVLAETDMVCSVPMMKTHVLATVTLGMKNLIGLYPGTIYHSVRSWVHDYAFKAGSPGIAFEIVDMVKANKLGLVVVDGSMGMEGDGPSQGRLVKMGVIVAGTNPLATDMIAARIMGFENYEVPTFLIAQKSGMTPRSINDIEVRGEKIASVERKFMKPNIVSWGSISQFWGVKEI
jgi:uncharacterized protein (DUF362 family)